MLKRIWSVLDGTLSVVGLCTLALHGFRYHRGLPVLPGDLFSAPAPTLASAPPVEVPAGDKPKLDAQAQPAASRAQKEPWNRVLRVTIQSARRVNSAYDLMLEDTTLAPDKRKNLERARDEMGKLRNEPLLGQMPGITAQSSPLLVCRVTVEYLGRSGTTLHPTLAEGFHLISTNREVFPHLNSGWFSGIMGGMRHVKFPEGQLLPGGSVSGDMVFHAKPDTQPAEIVCSTFNLD